MKGQSNAFRNREGFDEILSKTYSPRFKVAYSRLVSLDTFQHYMRNEICFDFLAVANLKVHHGIPNQQQIRRIISRREYFDYLVYSTVDIFK
jgi:hypothetical protein